MSKTKRQVVIIGGGITGLTTAYYLQKQIQERQLPLSIKLVEASPKLGGKMQTYIKDGFVIEPKGSDPGAIYVWAITYKGSPFETVIHPLDPRITFQVLKPGIPRSYKLPYSKQQHKKITKKKKQKGTLLFWTKKEGLKLKNPEEILFK